LIFNTLFFYLESSAVFGFQAGRGEDDDEQKALKELMVDKKTLPKGKLNKTLNTLN